MEPMADGRHIVGWVRGIGVAALIALVIVAFAQASAWLLAALAAVAVVALLWPRRLATEALNVPLAQLARLAEASPTPPKSLDATGAWLRDLARRLEARLAADEGRAAQAVVRTEGAAAILAGIEEPLVSIGADGRIDFCNPAAAALFKSRAERLMGRTPDEAFTHAELHSACARAAAGERARCQIRIGLGDAARVLDVSVGPASPAPRVVLVFRDTTELSQALQMKTDFVANASHELRTPLAAARLALETLESLGDEPHEMRGRILATITGNVARLEQMIRDLLDLSRLESPEVEVRIEALPASDLAAELATLYGPACEGRRVALRFELAPALEGMRTDRSLLMLILSNLIDNAISFAGEGTDVRVVGRPSPTDASAAVFEVIDKGQGIPVHLQQRIFERYYQVDAARDGGIRRGTGLGLAIVKHAVRRLGGSVRVNSIWKQGTTMIVEVPGCLSGATAANPR
ncbi:MAG: sensor histidine kinase [Phycisphaerales bacterium]